VRRFMRASLQLSRSVERNDEASSWRPLDVNTLEDSRYSWEHKKMNKKPAVLRTILSLAGLLPVMVSAQIPDASADCRGGLDETTPSSEFTLLEGGAVVRHDRTGLDWQRCVVGMEWDGAACSGRAVALTWQEALNEVGDGWRLPNINELRSIIERCRTSPSINRNVFPNTPSARFWSASPVASPFLWSPPDELGDPWRVGFSLGIAYWPGESKGTLVRAVRGGQ